jgi:GT2 family glycosyltransferase
MTAAVLITNYDAWESTCRVVHATLHNCGYAINRILIVDDASDAPDHWEHGGPVEIVRNPKNLGYAASINVGMSFLNEDVVVILDCDACPRNDVLKPVLKLFQAEATLGAVGFMQTDDSHRLRPSAEPCPTALEFIMGPSLLSRLPVAFARMVAASNRSAFLCIHSCCFAVRNQAFRQVHGFDTTFDFLDADIDFSLRLSRNRWRTQVTTEALCFHPGGGSPQSTNRRVLRFHRNRWRLLRKHGLLRRELIAKACLAARHIIEIIVLAVAIIGGKAHARTKLDGRWKLLCSVFSDYQSAHE